MNIDCIQCIVQGKLAGLLLTGLWSSSTIALSKESILPSKIENECPTPVLQLWLQYLSIFYGFDYYQTFLTLTALRHLPLSFPACQYSHLKIFQLAFELGILLVEFVYSFLGTDVAAKTTIAVAWISNHVTTATRMCCIQKDTIQNWLTNLAI